MTSNAAPAPGAPAGRRRALGRGPTAAPLEPEHEPRIPERGPEPPGHGPEAAGAEPGVAGRDAEDSRDPEDSEEQPQGLGGKPAVPADEPPIPGRGPGLPEGEPEASGGGPAVPADGTRIPGRGPGLPEGERRDAGREPGGAVPQEGQDVPDGVFTVRLANFEGPFDLLLQLISKHKLDVTEVALSKVTDEFMAHIRAMGPDWDLDQTTEFLVVAATLLDLKAARLLPAAEVEDEADLALLEARDLLFARLLQYRAYKQIADIFNQRLDDEARRFPRTVGLEPEHAELLPEVVISIGPEGFARLAVKAMQPRPKPQVYVDHIHAPLVSVQEQAGLVVARLRELGEASFRVLIEDTDDTLTVVARFLALLELYREKAVALEQETALGELTVRWTGGDADRAPVVTDEFDRPPEKPEEKKA
ncbi:segregation/condensation protein A [Streptomyces sp. NPDC042638]|uniref:segregation/condensation protein A n=1 Tax=Streptomyces sp. NPDC042638 TaxID=3154333 RepID=UPI0033C1E43A